MGDFESLVLYLVVTALATIAFSMYRQRRKMVRVVGLIMSVLLPTIMAGIRVDVGTDYENYYWTFEHLKTVDFKWILTDATHFRMDRGFLLLSKVFCFIFDAKVIFAIWSAVILTLIVGTLYNYRKDYDVVLVYYIFLSLYYFNSFNILRQIIATSIMFFAIQYVFKNKPVRFFVLIGIAATIHFSAVLAIPIWFLWNHKSNQSVSVTKKWGVLLGAFLLASLWQRLLPLFTFLHIDSLTKYSGYLSGNDHTNMSFLIKLVITIVLFCLQKRLQREDEKINFLILLFAIGMLIDYTGYTSSFVKRGALYYSIGEIILFSRFTLLVEEDSKQITRLIIMITVSAYFIVGAYILRQGGLIPFHV